MSSFLMVQVAVPSTDMGKAIGGLADFLVTYLTPLVVVWALSVASIGLWKKLLDKHTKFFARRWVSLICANATESVGAGSAENALAELLQLCSGVGPVEAALTAKDLIRLRGLPRGYVPVRKPAHYLFALESEPMMASVQECVDIVMASPGHYESLYRVLTNGAPRDDVETWFRSAHSVDHEGLTDDQRNEEVRRRSDIAARLRKTIKSKLNSFQSYTSDAWQNWNELATSLTGIVIMLVALIFSAWASNGGIFTWGALAGSFTVTMIPVAVGTGVLLPYVKDLLGTVQKAKH